MYKENLKNTMDKVIEGGNNELTLEDYIRESEAEFLLEGKDLENISEEDLKEYIELIDRLWEEFEG